MYSPEGLDSRQCLSGSMTISPTGYHGVAKRSSWASSRIRDIMALPSAGVGASAAPRCPRYLCVYYCRTYCKAVCGGGGGQCHSEGYVQDLQDCACRRDGRTPILSYRNWQIWACQKRPNNKQKRPNIETYQARAASLRLDAQSALGAPGGKGL